MPQTAQEKHAEALDRAQNGQTVSNYPAIFDGFTAKGIPESNILPRENIFTYGAWRALGRQVRKGEHGVKVRTYVECTKKDAEHVDPETGQPKEEHFKKRRLVTVFHVSQTDIATPKAPRRPKPRKEGAQPSALPPRTADTMSDAIALSSPSGKMSKRARKAAERRLSVALFGEGGIPKPKTRQPSRREALLAQANRLRDLAARGMRTRAYRKQAAELEAEAAALQDEEASP